MNEATSAPATINVSAAPSDTGTTAPTTTTGTAPSGVSSTPAASGAAPSAPAGDWTSALPDEMKGYIANKGFKEPGQAMESYRNMEKLLGVPETRRLTIPENMDDATAMNGIYEKLGRPKTPEGYGITAAKENGDVDFVNFATKTFHELGLSAKQGKALADKIDGFSKARLDADTAKQKADADVAINNLKTKWGAAYDQNVKRAKAAVEEFGINGELLGKFETIAGYPDLMEIFSTIGEKLGSKPFATGEGPAGFDGMMTPAQASAQIAALKQDSGWLKRWSEGGTAEKLQVDKLSRFMAGTG